MVNMSLSEKRVWQDSSDSVGWHSVGCTSQKCGFWGHAEFEPQLRPLVAV